MFAMFLVLGSSLLAISQPERLTGAILKTGGVTLKDVESLTEAARTGKTRLAGNGSGFFISPEGLILTNHHVVEGAKELVAVWNGTAYRMMVVAKNKDIDIALLKLNGIPIELKGGEIDFRNCEKPTFPYLGTGATKFCDVGDEVYVVGYPKIALQGMEAKVTRGIVSSLSGFKGEAGCFQMDAAIQGGNSGGPVVDAWGAVVGVSVATLTGGQNVNYAIKLSEVEKFLSGQKVELPPPPKMPYVRSAMVKKVVAATALILNYGDGARPLPYDDETKSVKERNETRARFEKTLLYAKLLKVRKEWKELKKLTDMLLKEYGENVGDGDIKELNDIACKELGEATTEKNKTNKETEK